MAEKISIDKIHVGQRVRVNSGIRGTTSTYEGEAGEVVRIDYGDPTIRVKLDTQPKDIVSGYWVWPDENGGFDVEILEDVAL